VKLDLANNWGEPKLKDIKGYQAIVGSLMYAALATQPDISFAVAALCRYTWKNDLTRRVAHREAVFGTVIHSIFDAWHYEVLWTYALTRLL